MVIDTIDTLMLDKIVQELQQFSPYSIFLYGSRGRGDNKDDSDYEVGVIFEDDKVIRRSELHKKVNLDSVRIYPFKLSEIESGELDTPFVNSIYLRELVEGGRTIFGEKVVEALNPQPITTLDLIRRVRFDVGYALAAILSCRTGDLETAYEEFSKSCLFGLRTMIILRQGKFIVGYDNIYEERIAVVENPEYLAVIEAAYSLRVGAKSIDSNLLFDNMSFLDYVEKAVLEVLGKKGNVALV